MNTIATLQPLLNAVFEFLIVNVQPAKSARRESNVIRHSITFLTTFSGLVFSTGAMKTVGEEISLSGMTFLFCTQRQKVTIYTLYVFLKKHNF